MGLSLLEGNEAMAWGAYQAGCRFFAGYPITPATTILNTMLNILPPTGGIVLQAEDEIAAMGYCIGASMAGLKVMTATSGPGLSLYSEHISFAIGSEIPLVIVEVQRLGPSTGSATRGADGDIQFMRWGTSGGYPLIVLSPSKASECYGLTKRAFDLAERFRVPVFLATDKEVVLTRTTIDIDSYEPFPVRERKTSPEHGTFTPYHYQELSDVPAMSPFGGPHIVRFTTSSHDEQGFISKKTDDVGRLNEHLSTKIENHLDEIALTKANFQDGAETLIISFGITSCSADEAVSIARRKGIKVSSLTIHSLWPVPEKQIRDAMDSVKRVVIPELNLGQYRREIERLANEEQDVIGVHRVDGELISPIEILDRGGIL